MPVLAVRDLAASLHFYVDVLGWTKEFELPGPDGAVNFAFVGHGPTTHFGLSTDEAPDPRGSGVAFMVYVPEGSDIDAYYAEVQSRGAAIAQPIKDEYWGDRTFGLADPDGYYLMIAKTTQELEMDAIAAEHANH